MPLPEPIGEEDRGDFVKRCVRDTVMAKMFQNPSQRAAVCHAQFEKKHPEQKGERNGLPERFLV